MPNRVTDPLREKPNGEKVEDDINDSSEAPPPQLSEGELAEHIGDTDTARVIGELLRGQRIAAVYIDARSGGVFFSGEAHITGDVVGQRQIKQPLEHSNGAYAEIVAGRVLDEDLDKVRSVYVKPPLYSQAYRVVSEKRVLILWGQAHWGKWTTALHLLLSLQVEQIFEIRPDVVLDDILSFEAGNRIGYLVDTLAPDSAQRLSPTILNRLSERFKKKDSYLVITVGSRVPLSKTALSTNLVVWNDLPDCSQLLKTHLSWYLADQDKLAQAFELSESDEVQSLLSTYLLPREIDRLAALLADVVHGKLELNDALSRFEARALQQVEEWFENHKEIEERTFMISVAVLSGASYQSVSSANERLLSLIKPSPVEGEFPSDTSFIFGSRSQRVREACAHLSQGYEETEFGRSPVEIIELNNPSFQPAVLHYIWNEYDRLREPLVGWLRDLGIQANSDVRVRVAAAVGELSKYSFGYIKEKILLPWANHHDKRARASAAFALGIPAWEGEFAPQVLGLLHHWSTLRNNWRLNWTAAAAYGGLVGLRFPDIALRDLHSIAKVKDLRLFAVLNRSIANLIYAGRVEPDYYFKVLDALIDWTNPPIDKIVALTGLLIFLDLMSEIEIEAIPDAERWPALLWLSYEEATYRERVITLWRRALNTKSARKPALETLKRLVQMADDDARLYSPLEQILRELVQRGSERERGRLQYYLNRWAVNPKEPSASASRLLEALNEALQK